MTHLLSAPYAGIFLALLAVQAAFLVFVALKPTGRKIGALLAVEALTLASAFIAMTVSGRNSPALLNMEETWSYFLICIGFVFLLLASAFTCIARYAVCADKNP